MKNKYTQNIQNLNKQRQKDIFAKIRADKELEQAFKDMAHIIYEEMEKEEKPSVWTNFTTEDISHMRYIRQHTVCTITVPSKD